MERRSALGYTYPYRLTRIPPAPPRTRTISKIIILCCFLATCICVFILGFSTIRSILQGWSPAPRWVNIEFKDVQFWMEEGVEGLYALAYKLPGLPHDRGLAAVLVQLPKLLHGSYVDITNLLTRHINNARSLSGTPACVSPDCIRIAKRSMEIAKNFKKISEAMFSIMAVVSILATCHYATKYLTLIFHMVVGSISTTFSGKWEPSARPPPPSPLHRPSMPLFPRPCSAGSGVRLGRLAEDASVLLEVFSKMVAESGADIGDDQKTMIMQALEHVLDIKKGLRLTGPEVEEKESGLCIICYDNVADMVVLPCKHLAMCMTCCDGMRIHERGAASYSTAKCPICRTVVTDRMKIFRS